MRPFVPRRCISSTSATVTWCLGPVLRELALPEIRARRADAATEFCACMVLSWASFRGRRVHVSRHIVSLGISELSESARNRVYGLPRR